MTCPDWGNPNVELAVRYFQKGVNVGFDCNDCECYSWTDGGSASCSIKQQQQVAVVLPVL